MKALIILAISAWAVVAVAEDTITSPQAKTHTTVTSCTTTCQIDRGAASRPTVNPMASVFTVTPPEKPVFVPLEPNTTVTHEPSAVSDWDVQTECYGYKGKFWEWRVNKCQIADPKWVSPGLGKTN